jgi:hypothetical protein
MIASMICLSALWVVAISAVITTRTLGVLEIPQPRHS